MRKNIGWPHKPFEVPEEIVKAWRKAGARNADACKAWKKRLDDSKMKSEFNAWTERKLPKGWDKALLEVKKAQCEAQKVQPTRAASKVCTEALMPMMPNFIGGSADLTPSNMSRADGTEVISKGHYTGQYIHYGVREHAMGAINVGMTLHKGVIPYCSTFFVFVDYMRTPVRLSALMEQPALYVYTHDSITQGPDGPDPPGGRALRHDARDAEHRGPASGLRRRGRGVLGSRSEAKGPSDRSADDPRELQPVP